MQIMYVCMYVCMYACICVSALSDKGMGESAGPAIMSSPSGPTVWPLSGLSGMCLECVKVDMVGII